AFAAAVAAMAAPWRGAPPDAVAGIESRGFILGAALALELGCGFVPVRKPGKLPARTLSQDYRLEYGSDRLEIHVDAVPPGARVLVVDDVLATGGTLRAATELLRRQGAQVIGADVLVELIPLGGRDRWDAAAPLRAALVRGAARTTRASCRPLPPADCRHQVDAGVPPLERPAAVECPPAARRPCRRPAPGCRCALPLHRSAPHPPPRSPSPWRCRRCTWCGARPISRSASHSKAAGRRC